LKMTTFPDIPEAGEGSVFTLTNVSGCRLPVLEPTLKKLMQRVEEKENIRFSELELVYVDEDEIISINKEHLDRDYVTDIISFRYDEEKSNKQIEGTLFCCAPRIEEQSDEEKTSPSEEFYRVFIHGLLHLAGYDDQTEEDKIRMTQCENHYLELLIGEL
jgi:probable rRNA maturation factor